MQQKPPGIPNASRPYHTWENFFGQLPHRRLGGLELMMHESRAPQKQQQREFGRMPRGLAMCPMCRVLVVGKEHQRREGHIEHRRPFLDRISYSALLLVAAFLGFEGALIALGASEATKTKPAPPAAFRVEMTKPPQCSIESPDRLVFL